MASQLMKDRVLTIRVLPSRPKWTRWSTLKQWCLFRVLRTYMVIETCHQVVDYTLMTLAIPTKLSSPRLAPYWLDAPSLTFARRRRSAHSLWGLHLKLYDCRNSQSPMVFRSPLELYHVSPSHQNCRCKHLKCWQLTLMRSLSLQREVFRVYLTRGCLTRYVPSSGFLNLLTAYSSKHPVALFHATGAHGIHPSELSPW